MPHDRTDHHAARGRTFLRRPQSTREAKRNPPRPPPRAGRCHRRRGGRARRPRDHPLRRGAGLLGGCRRRHAPGRHCGRDAASSLPCAGRGHAGGALPARGGREAGDRRAAPLRGRSGARAGARLRPPRGDDRLRARSPRGAARAHPRRGRNDAAGAHGRLRAGEGASHDRPHDPRRGSARPRAGERGRGARRAPRGGDPPRSRDRGERAARGRAGEEAGRSRSRPRQAHLPAARAVRAEHPAPQ